MEVVIAIVAILAALTAAGWAIGTLLPPDQEATREAKIAAPLLEVWALLTDYEAQTNWHPEVDRVDILDNQTGRVRWREHHKSGETNIVEEVERITPRRVRWRFEETHRVFCAEWDLQLAPDDGGTQLKVTQRATVRNPLARFAALVLVGRSASLALFLDALGEELARRRDNRRVVGASQATSR